MANILTYSHQGRQQVAKTDKPVKSYGQHFHKIADGRLQCDLCPRLCKLAAGQQGLCFVREHTGAEIELTSYGRSSGFCVDPIEKKPLNHFLPGTPVLSFGTAGCNLACKFCQNWDISKSRQMDTLAAAATPEMLAKAALEVGARSIAFTYNDPVIFHEYAIDVAIAAKEVGVASVAVTAGYVMPAPRIEFFKHMQAANIDLKAFSEGFYKQICGGSLAAVLDTLVYLKQETNVWFELTTLLIPGENDRPAEIQAMAEWIVENLGPDVPLHFTAFHPDYKMMNHPATPAATLLTSRRIARAAGLRYVYCGNINDPDSGASYCPGCNAEIIQRDRYELGCWQLQLDDGSAACTQCGTKIAGVFETTPGTWGRRRLPVSFN